MRVLALEAIVVRLGGRGGERENRGREESRRREPNEPAGPGAIANATP